MLRSCVLSHDDKSGELNDTLDKVQPFRVDTSRRGKKWQIFHRRPFQIHLVELKLLHLYSKFKGFVTKGPIANKLWLGQVA